MLLDEAFPQKIVGDTRSTSWPHLRRNSRQNWYDDRRNPSVGFLSRDEAVLLYNIALRFQGVPVLEIGCWRGWSTAHLALGAGNVEVIDPVLLDEEFAADVKASLKRAGVLDSVVFHPGFSPGAVEEISLASGKRWGLTFVDGDHEGEAPRRDALAVAGFAADDAMIVFHDLMSPYVADGLRALRDQGWNIRLYQTMQIMGVAWRGDVNPVNHIADPNEAWDYPSHLADLVAASAPPPPRAKSGGSSSNDERVQALEKQAQENELLIQTLVGQLEAAAPARDETVRRLEADHAAAVKGLEGQLAELAGRLSQREQAISELQAGARQHNQLSAALGDLQAQHVKLLGVLGERDAVVLQLRGELTRLDGAVQAEQQQKGELQLLAAIHEASLVRTERALAAAEHKAWVAQRSALEMEEQLLALRSELAAALERAESQVAEPSQEDDAPDLLPDEEPAGESVQAVSDEARLEAFLNWYTHPRVLAGVLRRVLSGSSRAAVGRQLADSSRSDAVLAARLQGLGSPRAVAATLARVMLSGRTSAKQRIRSGLGA